MNKEEIFKLIKDECTSYGEARRYASQWIELPEKKQESNISNFLTVRLATKTARHFHAGEYKKAAQLMCEVGGMTREKAVADIKRSRVEARHCIPIWIGGCGGPDGQYHWPHCKCGWQGENIHGEGSSDKARKAVCPNLIRELSLYGLEYKRS